MNFEIKEKEIRELAEEVLNQEKTVALYDIAELEEGRLVFSIVNDLTAYPLVFTGNTSWEEEKATFKKRLLAILDNGKEGFTATHCYQEKGVEWTKYI
jgi:hypothetical protein